MPVGSNLAGVARVAFEADTGQFNTQIAAAEQRYRATTGAMSDDALRLSSAQDRLNRSISRYGPQSRQAADATLRLRSAQRQTEGETRRTTSAIDRQERSLSRLVRGAVAGTGAFGHLRSAFVLGSTSFLGGFGAVAIGKAFVQAASNVQEETEKTGVVFGKNAEDVQRWSRTLAESFGVGEGEALRAAGIFGNMLRPLHFGEAAAAGMSKRLVELAADLASFNNTSPAETLQALSSGLAGQVRPLRAYGVFLSQARIQQEAYADGIAKQGAKLSQAQKVQASYNIILKDTRQAQGDVARNTGSLSVAQSKLKAAFEDNEAAIARGALPALVDLTNAGAKFFNNTENQARIQRDTNEAFHVAASLAHGLSGAIAVADEVTGSFKNTLKLLAGAFVALKFTRWAREVGLLKDATVGATAANEALAVSETQVAESAVVSRISAYTGAITTAGGAAEVAAVRASRLSKALAGLSSLGPIAITIALTEVLLHKGAIDKFGNKIDDKLNSALGHVGVQLPKEGLFGHKDVDPNAGASEATIELQIAKLNKHRERNKKEIASLNALLKKMAQADNGETPPSTTTTTRNRGRGGTADAGTGIPYLDLLLAQAEGTRTRADDERIVQQVIRTLQVRLAKAKTLKSKTALTQAVSRYQGQLEGLRQQDASDVEQARTKAEQVAKDRRQKAADARAKSLEIPEVLQTAAAKAALTNNESDDIRVARQEKAFLQRQLRTRKVTLTERRALYEQLAQVNQQITQLEESHRQRVADAMAKREERQDLLLERRQARADLTPGTADDLKVLNAEERLVRQRLARLAKIKNLTNDELRAQIDLLNKRKEIQDKRKELRNQDKSDSQSIIRDFLSAQRGLYGGASNVFTQNPQGQRAPGSTAPTTVTVNQHFNAPPTTDGHREAIYAKHAAMSAFDG